MNTPNITSTSKAELAWGFDLPDWVKALSKACDETSQNQVAKKLDISGSQISQIISRKYKGVYDNAENMVRSSLMREVVTCRVFDCEIALSQCIENQQRLSDGRMSGSELGFFRHQCPNCPNFKQK
ncbi:MAG: helix-turn-helix transcriptional regulator [Rhizobiales bacterium]|nr:helix-turn-helix transcriptional regulator [Hyphomicrobiales bacterium]